MDFGDILDQWETQQKAASKQVQRPKGSGKKLNAPSLYPDEAAKPCTSLQKASRSKEPPKPRANPMDVWMRRYGVVDKDRAQEQERERARQEDPALLQHMAHEAELDLHGLTRDEAWDRLERFITECRRRKLKKVLIIHGKGNHSGESPVLSGMVRTFIERDYRLGASGHPNKRDGGRGATWVLLRQDGE